MQEEEAPEAIVPLAWQCLYHQKNNFPRPAIHPILDPGSKALVASIILLVVIINAIENQSLQLQVVSNP